MTVLHRHAFVWLDSAEETAESELLREWLEQDRPLVVRRPCLSDDGKNACLGLALPPSPTKRRIPFELPLKLIRHVAEPPVWSECGTILDEAVLRLDEAAKAGGVALRAFGSHAWQHLTGLSYVTGRSDIDLLMFLESRASWDAVRETLSRVALPDRIDLEFVLKNDASFSWREFAGAGKSLLFKGNSSVWLGDRADIERHLNA